MSKGWLWDKKITDKQARKILSDKNSLKFIFLSATLLSRKGSAKEVFLNYISKEDFFVCWNQIKKQMRKNDWNDSRIEYWQAIYETLNKTNPEFVELKQKKFEVPVSPLLVKIANIIKEERKRAGLSQKKMAKKLKVSQQVISRIESGKQNISIDTLGILCNKLGIVLNVDSFGIKEMEKQEVTRTKHIYPFRNLSPDDFERLCFCIVERSKEFDHVEHYGGIGDKGRDIIAYKHNMVGKQEKWYFQCKRYSKISFKNFKTEIDKIKKYSDDDSDFKPDVIVFVTACSVSPSCKDKVKDYIKNTLFLSIVYFWTDVELDVKVRATGCDKIFLKQEITESDLEKINDGIEEFKEILTAQTDIDISKKDDINNGIKDAVKLIHEGEFDCAKKEFFKILGKIEDKQDSYKSELARVYNNLGVCFNKFKVDGGDFDEAEKYIQFALELDPGFEKARINLAIVLLNKDDVRNIKKAYDIMRKLWDNSDKTNPLIFEVFIWSLYYESPRKAVNYYENSKEAQALVIDNEKLLNFIGQIYLISGNFDKAKEFADKALSVFPNSPYSKVLKARALLVSSCQKNIDFSIEIIPKFLDDRDIREAFLLFTEAFESLRDSHENNFFLNQIFMDISKCSLYLKEDGKQLDRVRKEFDELLLNKEQRKNLKIDDAIRDFFNRNFESAYLKLKDHLSEFKYEEICIIAHDFFLKGGCEQAKEIFREIEEEAEKRKDVQYWVDVSNVEILLNNKNFVMDIAYKIKEITNGKANEKKGLEYFNKVMFRYVLHNESDRLMKGLIEYNKRYPEDNSVREIKAINQETGELTDEVKNIFFNQKEWYEKFKQSFIKEPCPSYFLEKFLKRPYLEILSFRNDPEFIIELTISDVQFEKELTENFRKAESLVFDYAFLLNISKMNLLGHLGKFKKKIYISRILFDKIQDELLNFEQEDLRRLWNFVRTSKKIEIVEESKMELKEEKRLEVFDDWIVDSIRLAKAKNAVFMADDLIFIKCLRSENIKACNSFIMLKDMLARKLIDEKIYAVSLGDLAERFYVFLPFSANNLFSIVIEDNIKITNRTYHLVNQMFLSGSNVESFINVFVKFIDLLWNTGSLASDKVQWLVFFTEMILKFIKNQGGIEKFKEVEKVFSGFLDMWRTAIQLSNRDDIFLLKEKIESINFYEQEFWPVFKDKLFELIKKKEIKF